MFDFTLDYWGADVSVGVRFLRGEILLQVWEISPDIFGTQTQVSAENMVVAAKRAKPLRRLDLSKEKLKVYNILVLNFDYYTLIFTKKLNSWKIKNIHILFSCLSW